MKTISFLSACLVLVFACPCTAQVLPQSNMSGKYTLKDEIAFETAKLLSYNDAHAKSKETQLPLVCFIGCNSDDITLFLTLKGKVILCYLQSNASPFTETNIGVVVGLWNAQDGQCKRHNIAPNIFNDQNFRNSLLFPKPIALNFQSVPIFNGNSTFKLDCVGPT